MALKVELKEVEGSVDLKGNSTATEELEAKVAPVEEAVEAMDVKLEVRNLV